MHKQLKYFLKRISLEIKHLVIKQCLQVRDCQHFYESLCIRFSDDVNLDFIAGIAYHIADLHIKSWVGLFLLPVFSLSVFWPQIFYSSLVSYTINDFWHKIDSVYSWFINYNSYFSVLFTMLHKGQCLNWGLGYSTEPLNNHNLE